MHLGTFYLRNNDVTWSLPLSHDPLHWMRSYCGIGVPIFYCLSGFILSMPFGKEVLLQGKRVAIKQFYGRRLTRLEPPYIIALTTFFCVSYYFEGAFLGHLPALFGKFLLFAYFDLRGVESDSTRRLDLRN